MGSWWSWAPSSQSAGISGACVACQLAMPRLLPHSALPCRTQRTCIHQSWKSDSDKEVCLDKGILFRPLQEFCTQPYRGLIINPRSIRTCLFLSLLSFPFSHSLAAE
jgi:hypothetical protein